MGLRTHTAVWASILLLAFFLFGHYFLPNGADRARIVVTGLAMGVFIAVVLTWWKKFWGAIRGGIRDGAQNIFVGVWLIAFVMVAYLAWVAYLVATGRPAWARETPVGGVFMVLFFLGGSALYLAPLNTHEEIEPVSLRFWLAAGVAGGLFAGVVITLAWLGIIGFP